MDFHKFYFDLGADAGLCNTTMASPKVRLLGDVAVVAYVRLVQSLDEGAAANQRLRRDPHLQLQSGKWRHVHFHRSRC